MVNQKAISARINVNTLWRIEQECMVSVTSRNRILNDGARLYLDLQDAKQAYSAHADPETRAKILNGFLKTWFPSAATW